MTQTLTNEFHSVCKDIMRESDNKALNYAVAYAAFGLTMKDPYAIRTQCLYILNNMTHWRGETAKRCRETLKVLSLSATWKETV